MRNREINKSPESPTAGLSSAMQLVDFTAAELFAIGNTSCSLPTIGVVVPLPQEPSASEGLDDRRADFATALRESVQKNRSVIRELAKY